MDKLEMLEQKITELENMVKKMVKKQNDQMKWLTNVTVDESVIKVPYIDFSNEDTELMLPKRNREGDIGYDAFSHERVVIPPHSSAKVSLGIGVIIPNGFGIACRTRGGNWLKGLLVGPAHVDLNYRGVINALLYNVSDNEIVIEKGDRPCSIDIYKTFAIEWQSLDDFQKDYDLSDEEMKDIMNTNRGDKGFGSSGN